MEDTDKRVPTVEQWKALDGVIKNSGVKVLTEADYNYPVNNPTHVGLWLLPSGLYYASKGVVASMSTSDTENADSERAYIVERNEIGIGSVTRISSRATSDNMGAMWLRSVSVSRLGQAGLVCAGITSVDVTDSLTSSSTRFPLSANQGRVLKNLIDSLTISGAGAPTTSTVGTVGKLYEDTTNGKLYICTVADTDTPEYTWVEISTKSYVDTAISGLGKSTEEELSTNYYTKAEVDALIAGLRGE